MELISGPDLGGGYLFQLTVERGEGRDRYIVHAQEGGLEAAAPAKGAPTEFGFSTPQGLCAFGGRECYHREYEVDEGELSRVRMTYNRTRFVLEPMFEQRFGARPIAVEAGLAEVVDRVAAAAGPERIPWFVGGSTSTWLQGIGAPPRDIDLGTDLRGVSAVAEVLADYLIEPAGRTTWPPDRELFAARAYVGTLQSGIRVEWAAALPGGSPPATADEWGWPAEEIRTVPISWNGRTVPVARLEYSLVRAVGRRDSVRARAIADPLRAGTLDLSLLDQLLERSDPRVRREVAERLGIGGV